MSLRILDIAVATAYGLLCLSLISFMGPYGFEHGSAQAAEDARAGSSLTSYVDAVGLPFLATAPPSQVCTTLEEWGNSTLTMGGSVGSYVCSAAPAESIGSSSLSLVLVGRQVTLEAWVEEP